MLWLKMCELARGKNPSQRENEERKQTGKCIESKNKASRFRLRSVIICDTKSSFGVHSARSNRFDGVLYILNVITRFNIECRT